MEITERKYISNTINQQSKFLTFQSNNKIGNH